MSIENTRSIIADLETNVASGETVPHSSAQGNRQQKVYGYVRSAQVTPGCVEASVGRQIAEIASYAETHDLGVVQIFRDLCVSGATLERDGLNRLLETLRQERGNVVIVEATDRHARGLES